MTSFRDELTHAENTYNKDVRHIANLIRKEVIIPFCADNGCEFKCDLGGIRFVSGSEELRLQIIEKDDESIYRFEGNLPSSLGIPADEIVKMFDILTMRIFDNDIIANMIDSVIMKVVYE